MKLKVFKQWVDYLSGKKSYIIGIVLLIVGFLGLFDVVTKQNIRDFVIVLQGAGLLTLRGAVSKDTGKQK